MRSSQREAGTTLVEVVIVVAIVALFIGVIGVFFLGTAPGAVSAAEHDVSNAFDEARRTAVAYEAATVVFAPEAAGRGFTARVYRAVPGDSIFRPVNGPIYENVSTVVETAVPLGAPGFAFAIAGSGTITGYRNYAVGGALDPQPCPPGDAFVLRLSAAGTTKSLTIPCHIVLHSDVPIVRESPTASVTQTAPAPGACPAGKTCTLVANIPGTTNCPPGYTQDPGDPALCDPPPPPPTPTSTSTAPAGGGSDQSFCNIPGDPAFDGSHVDGQFDGTTTWHATTAIPPCAGSIPASSAPRSPTPSAPPATPTSSATCPPPAYTGPPSCNAVIVEAIGWQAFYGCPMYGTSVGCLTNDSYHSWALLADYVTFIDPAPTSNFIWACGSPRIWDGASWDPSGYSGGWYYHDQIRAPEVPPAEIQTGVGDTFLAGSDFYCP